MPNQSPEPTTVGAAIAIPAGIRRWFNLLHLV